MQNNEMVKNKVQNSESRESNTIRFLLWIKDKIEEDPTVNSFEF